MKKLPGKQLLGRQRREIIILYIIYLRETYYGWVVNGNGSGPPLTAGFGISSVEPLDYVTTRKMFS